MAQNLDVQTALIELGRPWENGSIESFNGMFTDALRTGDIVDTVIDARVIAEEE
jgi:putative transposase